MHAVIAVFYGLFTFMLMVVYAIIARPDLVGLALVLGPFIASGMTLALLLLDAIVAGIERGVRRLMPQEKKRRPRC